MWELLSLWRSTNTPGVVNTYPMGGEWVKMRVAVQNELMAAAAGLVEVYIIVDEKEIPEPPVEVEVCDHCGAVNPLED